MAGGNAAQNNETGQPVSNTGDNRRNAGQFRPGDPRINRKGRPKSFDAWRALTIEILREPAIDPKTGQPIVIDGHIATNAEMIARSWLRDPKRQQALIETAFGKVPDRVEVSGRDGSAIEIKAFDYGAAIAHVAPRPVGDRETSREDQGDSDGPAVGQVNDGG